MSRQGFVLREAIPTKTHLIHVGDAESDRQTSAHITWEHWTALTFGPIWAIHGSLRQALIPFIQAIAAGQLENAATQLRDLRGSFALLLISPSQLWLYSDPMGAIQLFKDNDTGVIGSSFLSVLEQSKARCLDSAAVLQYLLAEAPHGGRTLIEGIELIPPGYLIALHRTERIDCWSSFWSSPVSPIRSFGEAIEALAEPLLNDFKTMCAHGLNKASIALSGGFDSRLVLALARQSGISHRVFVYGEADSSDVRVANTIGQAEGLPIEHVDKHLLNESLATAPPLDANLNFFDGFCADGFMDRGADRLTRLQQGADGRVILNGGGGEILRNFFHLGPGAHYPSQIVDAFYSQYPRSLLRSSRDHADYRHSMTQAVSRTHSSGPRVLDRIEVELLYPLFRCRWWMSRNSSIANRTGPFLTPLLSPSVIRLAASLDLNWKRAGKLEAALISRIDPALARHTSSYGFNFSAGPGPLALLREKLHESRPVWSRPMIAALGYRHRQRSANLTTQHSEHQTGWIQAHWFAPDATLSHSLQQRLRSLQALADRFSLTAT
jgi:asparagine synthase (glutamine-hydrolysing)